MKKSVMSLLGLFFSLNVMAHPGFDKAFYEFLASVHDCSGSVTDLTNFRINSGSGIPEVSFEKFSSFLVGESLKKYKDEEVGRIIKDVACVLKTLLLENLMDLHFRNLIKENPCRVINLESKVVKMKLDLLVDNLYCIMITRFLDCLIKYAREHQIASPLTPKL